MRHARRDYDRIQDPAGKIPEDEPVFLLRGQDKHAAATVLFYAATLMNDPSVDDDIITKAIEHAQRMREWPTHKTPDVPWGS